MLERKISMTIPEGQDPEEWANEAIAAMRARANEIMKKIESHEITPKQFREHINQGELESLENISNMQKTFNSAFDEWLPKMIENIRARPQDEKQIVEKTQDNLKQMVAIVFKQLRMIEHEYQQQYMESLRPPSSPRDK